MSTAIRASLKIGLGFVLFLAGYSYCRYVHSDDRYSIFRRHGEPFVHDHQRGQSLPLLQDDFQMGSLEYRLEQVLNDERLPDVLAHLSGDYDG
jgi:hypothetical protein